MRQIPRNRDIVFWKKKRNEVKMAHSLNYSLSRGGELKMTPALYRMRFRTPKQKKKSPLCHVEKRNAKRIRLTCSVATVLKTEKFELVVKFNSLIHIR
ncbi:hypothetical protein CEXT_632301 [Caerostris extrusa]|uniref:Uncharacterized protein n=1 Tax=Caerostris extrusa TaxID=172846 RepID=A0AAV4Y3N5_CAEEX|nr:hypothetical protein CEXT_632301 [Caerostris extrusa]